MRGLPTVLLFLVLSGPASAQEQLGPGRGFPDRLPGPGIDVPVSSRWRCPRQSWAHRSQRKP